MTLDIASQSNMSRSIYFCWGMAGEFVGKLAAG